MGHLLSELLYRGGSIRVSLEQSQKLMICEQSGAAHFTDGSKVDYELTWFRGGFPERKIWKDRLGIHLHFDTKYDGLINSTPQKEMDGVLCEISDKTTI